MSVSNVRSDKNVNSRGCLYQLEKRNIKVKYRGKNNIIIMMLITMLVSLPYRNWVLYRNFSLRGL